MKNQFLLLLLVLTLLASCNMKHDYKYVETILDKSVFGGIDKKEKDPVIIKAESDSAAYLEAYQKFCISVKVNKDMKASLRETYSTPLSFKIYNDKGTDITYTLFASKLKKEKEIDSLLFSMDNIYKPSSDQQTDNFPKTSNVDSAKVKELKKYFRITGDEFSNKNKKLYIPKSAPQYVNRNGIYCYFQTENGVPSNLRFVVQYTAEDWLFFEQIKFSVDDKAFNYNPLNVETDHGSGRIWEWFDESLTSSDKELIIALANAKKAKMKFIGRQYYNVKTISQDQIISIKRTIDMYNAMGGQY